jgi:hypothetical protein
MGHDPKVTRLYSLRKPAPNVAAFGRAGEGHTGALALIFIDIPRMSHKEKVLAAQVGLGGSGGPQSSNKTCKAHVRAATGEDSE